MIRIPAICCTWLIPERSPLGGIPRMDAISSKGETLHILSIK